MKSMLLILLVMLVPSFFPRAQATQRSVPLKPTYQHGRWGYADHSGKMAIEARFDAALPFNAGLARVGVVDEELPEIDGRPNLLWGYIDEQGRVVVELKYNALRDFSEGLAAGSVLNPAEPNASVFAHRGLDKLRWGYLDRNGRVVIQPQFRDAGDFSEGLAQVDVGGDGGSGCGPPHKYGYIDKTGAFVIKPQFTHAAAFKNGRAGVSIGTVRYVGRCLCCAPRFVGKYGHIDRKGEFVAERTTTDEGDSSLDPDRREVHR